MSSRRTALTTLAALAGGWPLAARPQDAPDLFEARTLVDALAALGFLRDTLQSSPLVHLTAPDVAENGAAVPLTLATSAPNATHLILLADGNPAPLVAVYELTPLLTPRIETRIKMAQSSVVRLVVRLDDGRALEAIKRVAVTQGGCGAE